MSCDADDDSDDDDCDDYNDYGCLTDMVVAPQAGSGTKKVGGACR